jgi:hypothetical protein
MSSLDMSSIILADGAEILHVRRSTGALVDGFFESGGEVDLSVLARVQPISPSDRKLLPEGVRVEDALSVFTLDPFVHEQSPGNGGRSPDEFFRGGSWWQIRGDSDYRPSGGGYVHSIATRLDKSRDTRGHF